MSKAFTRELDELPERSELKPVISKLPAGAKNYVTPAGLENLRHELDHLNSAPISPANRQRIFELHQILQTAVAVQPPSLPWNQVLFGATVTVRNQTGENATYRIVGVDETDLGKEQISWLSPLAKALLKTRIGDRVCFRTPAGEQELKIIQIRYES